MKKGTCFICGRKDLVDSHHIIPQTFGGKDGPLVNLCSTDHQKIHAQALNFESKQPNVMLFNENEWARAKRLVDYIILAIRKNRDNPDYSNPSSLRINISKYDVFLLHLMKEDAKYTNLQDYVSDLLKAFIKTKFPAAGDRP